MPSIPVEKFNINCSASVLNLVINGMPSIRYNLFKLAVQANSFKPCYKWNAFNTW